MIANGVVGERKGRICNKPVFTIAQLNNHHEKSAVTRKESHSSTCDPTTTYQILNITEFQ